MLITYSYRTYPRTQPVWSIGRSERDRLARSRYRRMAAGPVRNISRMQFKNTSDITLQTDTNRHDNGGELHAKLMSSDRAGFETRCLRGQAAAAGLGRGAGGRRRGLARQHTGTPTDWRPSRGLRGLATLPVGAGEAWPEHSSTARLEAAARTAGPGRASRRGTERSSAAEARGRAGLAAAGNQATGQSDKKVVAPRKTWGPPLMRSLT